MRSWDGALRTCISGGVLHERVSYHGKRDACERDGADEGVEARDESRVVLGK